MGFFGVGCNSDEKKIKLSKKISYFFMVILLLLSFSMSFGYTLLHAQLNRLVFFGSFVLESLFSQATLTTVGWLQNVADVFFSPLVDLTSMTQEDLPACLSGWWLNYVSVLWLCAQMPAGLFCFSWSTAPGPLVWKWLTYTEADTSSHH